MAKCEIGVVMLGGCFTLYIHEDGIWGPGQGYWYFKDYGMSETFRLQGNKIWRHLGFQFDEVSNRVRFFIDGQLVIDEKPKSSWGHVKYWGSKTTLFDSSNCCFGAISMADFRLYVHSLQGPLTPDEVYNISSEPTPFLKDKYKCLPLSSEGLLDQDWKDWFGHDCEVRSVYMFTANHVTRIF